MFNTLGLDERLLKAIDDLGFEAPTDIQADAIPPLVEGRDIVARARTGAGKTAAFGLPLLHKLRDCGQGTKALVLAPTRELAVQVSDSLSQLAAHLKIGIVTVYGGSAYGPQLKALGSGVPVVVGTPGRLIDHLEKGSLDLSGVEMVVIDEADEMLRMGFLEEVERLLGATPSNRQTALFSATMPPQIRRVAEGYLNDPLTVESGVEAGTTVDHVKQRAVVVPPRFKQSALIRYLKGEAQGATLVFCRTRQGCAQTAEALQRAGIDAEPLHGDLAQSARETVLNRLRSSRIDVVVATDVAARGLDVEHITDVINLDLPDNPEVYTHRIGRTGRAGRDGTALTILSPAERGRMRWMQRVLNADIDGYTLPTDADIAATGRARLLAELAERGEGAESWVGHLLAEGADPVELAQQALALLARARGVSLRSDLPDTLPDWANPPRPRNERRGDDRRDDGHRDNADRGPRPSRGRPDRADDEVRIFIGAGRRQGVRPQDLVGALANDTGISGRQVGQITIRDHNSFVGLSAEVAEQVLQNRETLSLRGRSVRLAREGVRPRRDRKPLPSKPRAADHGPREDQQDGGGEAPARKPMKSGPKAAPKKHQKPRAAKAPQDGGGWSTLKRRHNARRKKP